MKTNHVQEIKSVVVVAIITGIIMLTSGVYVAGSKLMFPPIMTVIFIVSSIITISSVVYYNKMWGN